MGMWSKLALLAAGALAGSVATRAAARAQPHGPAAGAGQLQRARPAALARRGTAPQRVRELAHRLGAFAARVKAGMDEREAQLREQFGVREPVDHTADHPGTPAPRDAVDPAAAAPQLTNHDRSSEGNNR